MSKDKDFEHSICFKDSEKKKAERIAALLKLDKWYYSFGIGLNLGLKHAEASVKGDTEVVFCTPYVAELIKNNQKFIEALCEEGVVEWLTPFVLTKSKQGGIAQSTPHHHQPTMKRLLTSLFANCWRGAAVKTERPLTKEEERLRKIDLTISQLQSTLSQMQQTESKLQATNIQLQAALLRMKQYDSIARMQRARSILRSTEFEVMQAQEVQAEIDAHRKEKQAKTPEVGDFRGHIGFPPDYDPDEDTLD